MTHDASSRPVNVAVCADLDALDVRPQLDRLTAEGHAVTVLRGFDKRAIIAEAAEADALMLGYGDVDEEVLEALPRLRMVALASMGFDNVDVVAAARRGVAVSHIVGAATEEVATHALALALDALRGISAYDRSVRAGVWDLEVVPVQPRISGLTLGVVGMGRIGAALAERARPLFGRIVGHDPFLPDDRIRRQGVEPAGLEEVLRSADVVSLHLPLTEQTAGLIDADALATMRQEAVLVNVSRGGLIDTGALRAALDAGRLRGAALDVLDTEPPGAGHPLIGHPRAIVTPHAGFRSAAALDDYVRLQAENVLAWARTGIPLTPVPVPALG
ncbi:C-terminal binding protein [Leifsonia sp. F6_8S_P_1B]|uniref:C-terminal binding protein n=1 Tax=Leifsonia williamsii TaxID=3035919 RepID=A0ABT8K8Q5_9MICO|nr:C-terminal binding protein [Leifsonia williamsii]MDN4613839.1 C-terminal binding protein [Leifsonia williamsii]